MASWEATWGRLNAISHSLYKKTHSKLFHLNYKFSLQVCGYSKYFEKDNYIFYGYDCENIFSKHSIWAIF